MTEISEEQLVLYELDETGIATITLNRPNKRNALNWRIFARISDILDEISFDQQIRVVVIRAVGDHFSAGIDLKLLSGQDKEDSEIHI